MQCDLYVPPRSQRHRYARITRPPPTQRLQRHRRLEPVTGGRVEPVEAEEAFPIHPLMRAQEDLTGISLQGSTASTAGLEDDGTRNRRCVTRRGLTVPGVPKAQGRCECDPGTENQFCRFTTFPALLAANAPNRLSKVLQHATGREIAHARLELFDGWHRLAVDLWFERPQVF